MYIFKLYINYIYELSKLYKLYKRGFCVHFHWLLTCWPWCIKGHTHTDDVKSTSDYDSGFSFLVPQKSFNRPFECLLYKTNRLHFSVRVYCNRSQKTSQRVKNNSHAIRLRLVSYFLYTLHTVMYNMHTSVKKQPLYN